MKWREIPLGYKSRIEEMQALLVKDPFLVLEVSSSANADEVKAAYRKKMSTYHPDKQGGFFRDYSQEMSKIINMAYENILKGKND